MYRALALTLLVAAGCRCNEDSNAPEKKTEEADLQAPAMSAQPLPSARPGEAPGNARFRVEGDWEAATTDASAVAWMSGDTLGRIELRTSQLYRRKERLSFNVQFKLPSSFTPAPGTVEIAPDHTRRSDAAGATVVVHTDFITVLAGDPTGELVLTRVSPTVITGTFRFQVWDHAAHTKHQRVKTATVTGNFTAATQQKSR